MALQDKLDAFKADFEGKLPSTVTDTMHAATDALRSSGIMDSVIQAGDTLPAFSLPNQDGDMVSSAELLAKGPLIISFFRGLWCPYCLIELEALNDAVPSFEAEGAMLVVISPQQQKFAKKTQQTKDLKFDELVDDGNGYADQLGITFKLPDDLKAIYSKFGVDVPTHNGDDSWRLPIPTRLVVGQDGTVLSAYIDPDYTVRPDPNETLAVLQARAAAE